MRLGQVAGTYRERRVAGALGEHFACAWSNHVGEGGPAIIVPDGCVDLVWMRGELRVAGPDRVGVVEDLPRGGLVQGLRFRPGEAMGWLGVPMSDLVGMRIAIADIWGARGEALRRRISGDADPVALLVRELHSMRVGRAAPVLGHVFDGRRDVNMSPRTLRRRCHEAFGYGPKTLERIRRFQRFLALCGRAGLSALAAEAGYADQAHLTRETRELSGLTPAAIVAQLRGRFVQDA